MSNKTKKLLILNLPYLVENCRGRSLVCTNLGEGGELPRAQRCL